MSDLLIETVETLSFTTIFVLSLTVLPSSSSFSPRPMISVSPSVTAVTEAVSITPSFIVKVKLEVTLV